MVRRHANTAIGDVSQKIYLLINHIYYVRYIYIYIWFRNLICTQHIKMTRWRRTEGVKQFDITASHVQT